MGCTHVSLLISRLLCIPRSGVILTGKGGQRAGLQPVLVPLPPEQALTKR